MPGKWCGLGKTVTRDHDTSRAFCEGRKYHAGNGVGNPKTNNPYTAGTDEAVGWDNGWDSMDLSVAASETCCAE